MTTKLVGLGYKARQGKSTLADAMILAGKGRVVPYSFAEELKRYCAAHHDELFEKYPNVPRTKKDDPIYGYTAMLQHYGTNVVRATNQNHWVEVLAARIEREKPEVALITDVRFPNEAAYVHDNGGVLVRIRRINTDGTQYIDPNRDPKHPSEAALDDFTDWDFLLDCRDGGVEQLKQAARILVETLLTLDSTIDEVAAGDVVPDNGSVPDSTGYSS